MTPSMSSADRAEGGAPVGPRRVSLILHKFSRGGSDRVAAYLARGFADEGIKVDLVVFGKGGEVEAILSQIVGDDIPVRYLGKAAGPRFLDLIRGLPQLVRLLRSEAPDAVISTANNTAWITAVAVKFSGLRDCRLILKTTNPIATSRHRGLLRLARLWGYRQAFRRTQAVWTLSAEESEEMRAEFPESASLFHDVANPYVTPAMLAPPTAKAPTAPGKTVISVARLTAQKRLDRLISAFALVRTPGVRLRILGEGEDREALAALVAELGLQDRVSMPGYVADVAPELHEADLFVLPSDYEGLPAAVLEAMAANCPVLGTDCFPAARSILGNAEGCAIIERTDPPCLAKLIEEHLAGPKPTDLRQVAERYSVANGVSSHLAALSRCY
jgi:glycosyltransferase involved in cell wall biosynthesis